MNIQLSKISIMKAKAKKLASKFFKAANVIGVNEETKIKIEDKA